MIGRGRFANAYLFLSGVILWRTSQQFSERLMETQYVTMSESPEDSVPILDPYDNEKIIELNFLFPHLDSHFSQVMIQTTGSMIRCNYDTPEDLGQLSHKIFYHASFDFTAYPCIEVLQEKTFYGSDADIRKLSAAYQPHRRIFFPSATSRLVELNTANQQGICSEESGKLTCLPSFQVTDFKFIPKTPSSKNQWKGTTVNVLDALKNMASNMNASAEKACRLKQEEGDQKYHMNECIRRTKFAVEKALTSINSALQKEAHNPNRQMSRNEMMLFTNNPDAPFLKKGVQKDEKTVVAETKGVKLGDSSVFKAF